MIGRDFLQADHIGIQLAQHIDDGVDPDAPVLATAPVNIPAYDAHRHLRKTQLPDIAIFWTKRSHGRIDIRLES